MYLGVAPRRGTPPSDCPWSSTLWQAYSLATSSAALILSQQLASRVSEAHTPPAPPPPPALPGVPPPPAPDCYGTACYRLTHLVIIALCALGTVCVAIVGIRTRQFYRSRL